MIRSTFGGTVSTPVFSSALRRCGLLGLVVSLVRCVLLPALRRLQMRQRAYEDAPQSHQTKTGTPTMGGIVFVIGQLLTLPRRAPRCSSQLALLVVACAASASSTIFSRFARAQSRVARAHEISRDRADRRRVPALHRRTRKRHLSARHALPCRRVRADGTALAVARARHAGDHRRRSTRSTSPMVSTGSRPER